MKLSIIASILFVLGLTTAPAVAGDFVGPGGVSVYVPDDWKMEKAGGGGEGVMVAHNDDAGVIYLIADAKNLKKANKTLEKILKKVGITKAKLGKAKSVDVNGFKGLARKGTAKDKDGKGLTVGVLLLELADKKVLVACGVVDTAKKDAYAATFDQIVAGIKPAN